MPKGCCKQQATCARGRLPARGEKSLRVGGCNPPAYAPCCAGGCTNNGCPHYVRRRAARLAARNGGGDGMPRQLCPRCSTNNQVRRIPLACSASAGSRSGGGRPTPLDGPCVAIRHAGPQEFSPTLKYQASVEDSQERFILVRSSERKRCLLRRIFLNSVTQKISDHRGPVRPACASNCRQALQMLRMVGRWSQRLGRRSAASAASEVYDYIGTCKTGSQDWQVFRCAGGGAVADASRVLLSWGRSLTSPARGRWGQLARSSARSPAIEACARGVGLRG
jgi:hypothetical protein